MFLFEKSFRFPPFGRSPSIHHKNQHLRFVLVTQNIWPASLSCTPSLIDFSSVLISPQPPVNPPPIHIEIACRVFVRLLCVWAVSARGLCVLESMRNMDLWLTALLLTHHLTYVFSSYMPERKNHVQGLVVWLVPLPKVFGGGCWLVSQVTLSR